MDLYGEKSPSRRQKIMILAIGLLLITASYWVLFGPLLSGLRAFGDAPSFARNTTLFVFNLVVFARFLCREVRRGSHKGHSVNFPR
jgi:hypothetical protein